MRYTDISPLIVTKYSQSFLIDTVRYFTSWNQRSEVCEKIQLNYLFKYLETDHVNAKTILVENEYIDRHFLEDYSKYYSRCFGTFSKRCARIHFFKNEFNEHQFLESLKSGDEDFNRLLSSNYLGFAVIRPIPDTFIARLSLRPYSYFESDPNYKLILNKTNPSLFGIKLELSTTAFIEQDRVVSECATSAIWTLLNADIAPVRQDSLPSLSTITQIASSSSNDGSKTYPNGGLTYKQVASTLKYFDLEPNVLIVNDSSKLKELVYAYVSNDIPVLLGGEVFTEKSNAKGDCYINRGRHFVCVLGYHRNGKVKSGFVHDEVDKIYVHDDRLGPYIRLSTDEHSFAIFDEKKQRKIKGLQLNIYDRAPEYIKPEVLIIGLYHKIRLTYDSIKSLSLAFGYYLGITSYQIKEDINLGDDELSKIVGEDSLDIYKSYMREINLGITQLVNGKWEIALTTNSKLKEELIKNKDFYTFNGSNDKAAVLIRSMPKYIWRIRIYRSNTIATDILIDATAVPQGHIIIGMITYNSLTDIVWRDIEERIKKREWQKLKLNEENKAHENFIKPFYKFYTDSSSNQSLNALYGYLGLPRREIKNGETDEENNIVDRSDLFTIRGKNTSWAFLRKDGTKYIWIIDEIGSLVIGEDIEVEDKYEGHPTLTDSKPARLGGELIYSTIENCWVINLNSGSYSSHLEKTSEQAKRYMQNVIENNLVGLDNVRLHEY